MNADRFGRTTEKLAVMLLLGISFWSHTSRSQTNLSPAAAGAVSSPGDSIQQGTAQIERLLRGGTGVEAELVQSLAQTALPLETLLELGQREQRAQHFRSAQMIFEALLANKANQATTGQLAEAHLWLGSLIYNAAQGTHHAAMTNANPKLHIVNAERQAEQAGAIKVPLEGLQEPYVELYEAAITHQLEAARLAPDSPVFEMALIGASYAYVELGRYEESRRCLERLLASKQLSPPNHDQALWLIATSLIKEHKWKEAEAALQRLEKEHQTAAYAQTAEMGRRMLALQLEREPGDVQAQETDSGRRMSAELSGTDPALNLQLALEDDARAAIKAEFRTGRLNRETSKTLNDLTPGRCRPSMSEIPDGNCYVYFSAAGYAPQWVRLQIQDHRATPHEVSVTLYRKRYVVIRYVINAVGERRLVGSGLKEGRCAVSHWGGLECFGRDWRIWQKSNGMNLFGKDPYLEFHRFSPSFGFTPAPVGVPFEELTEAPDKDALLLLRLEDFKNLGRLALKLRDATDPLSQYLRAQCSPDTVRLLQTYEGQGPLTESVQNALVGELNRLVQGESLYDEQRFAQVNLSQGTQLYMNQKPKGRGLVVLNCLLLADAYPAEIALGPREQYNCNNALAERGLTLFCRVRGDGVGEGGLCYGKLMVEDVTEHPEAGIERIEGRY